MAGRKKLPARLPCPFCGNAKQADLQIADDQNGGWGQDESVVKCYGCEAQGPPSTEAVTAVQYWNDRSTEEPA